MPAVHVLAGSSDEEFIRTPSGVLVPAEIDPFHRHLHHIAPSALIDETTQTTGMRRAEAISGKTVGACNLWMGQTHVPASTASANHHHGDSETAIYIVSGNPVFVFLDTDGDEPVESRRRHRPHHPGGHRGQPRRTGLVRGSPEAPTLTRAEPDSGGHLSRGTPWPRSPRRTRV
ncbi:hypothetical protein [Nocardioides sp. NPDC047086]|uniref:hypothetical protein n=1 Tax=Nocardioides sp. NPDC047086 TaxID=3154810 RepID=UPI003403340D